MVTKKVHGKQIRVPTRVLTCNELMEKKALIRAYDDTTTRKEDKVRHDKWWAKIDAQQMVIDQQAAEHASTRATVAALSTRTDLIVAQQEADYTSSSVRHDKSEEGLKIQSADIHELHDWSKTMVTAHNALEQRFEKIEMGQKKRNATTKKSEEANERAKAMKKAEDIVTAARVKLAVAEEALKALKSEADSA